MTTLVDLLASITEGPATYGSFSTQIYLDRYLSGKVPNITTDFTKLQAAAQQVLPPDAYDYAAGSAGTAKTLASNLAAFDKINIVPRVLRPILPKRDLSITLFGRKIPAPIVMAPIGVQRLFHPEGELAVSKVFGNFSLPFALSTSSSSGLDAVAEANGEGNPRWFQLYWPNDDDLTKSYLDRAKAAKYEVLVVTVDTWALGWRPTDLDRGTFPFINGLGTSIGLEDPVAHQKLGFDATAANATDEQKLTANLYHVITTSSSASPVWENVHKLREWWGDGPIVIKGITSAEDAQLAIEHGLDGIIVSNHGGRQLDGAVASLEALVSIVDAVKGQITIGFDSGIRSGADMFKALAIGADFVEIGRPIVWGLALGGEDGVRHVLKSLLADFEIIVGLAGCRGLYDIGRQTIANVKQALL